MGLSTSGDPIHHIFVHLVHVKPLARYKCVFNTSINRRHIGSSIDYIDNTISRMIKVHPVSSIERRNPSSIGTYRPQITFYYLQIGF